MSSASVAGLRRLGGGVGVAGESVGDPVDGVEACGVAAVTPAGVGATDREEAGDDGGEHRAAEDGHQQPGAGERHPSSSASRRLP